MTINQSPQPAAHYQEDARVELLERIVDSALIAGHRHIKQFSRLAALARAIANEHISSEDRATLIGVVENIAHHAELDATLDMEFFGGVRAGQVIGRLVRMAGKRSTAQNTCVISASDPNVTKH
ncbi:hypothetical protein [Paraburkholderia rhizosphaerae]|uniref:Uncharacterized protein n=1 Tax=Paraburkholderia rhizosphaerae TaxID=480658 RepID=A0A4R8LKU7_9BURK|nr:hypothetical protein [Paraburkholderia rhizosphaerae]TDY45152.1 hypothetical protein BX592_115119 [Paraburkholderia rhizosphaerae]